MIAFWGFLGFHRVRHHHGAPARRDPRPARERRASDLLPAPWDLRLLYAAYVLDYVLFALRAAAAGAAEALPLPAK